jgi:hypothetical protein
MNRKKLQIIALVALGLLMAGLIPLTVFLTGGRDISDFTQTDKLVFGVFLALELCVVTAMLLLANKLGKANLAARPELAPPKLSPTERIIRRRSILLQVLAGVLALLACFLGAVAGKALGEPLRARGMTLSLCVLAAVPLLGLLSWLIGRGRAERLRRMNVEQLQSWIQSHREQAESVAESKLRLLGRLRRASGAYAVLITLLGLAGAFFAGAALRTDLALPVLLAAMITDLGVTRFRFPTPQTVLQESGSLLDEEDFPTIYALSRKAARAYGRKAPLRIALTADCNAGIGWVNQTDLLRLGATLLSLFSEEELYTVLLHEFGHGGNERARRETDYATWMENARDRHFLSLFSRFLFRLPDDSYELHYALYRYAAAIGEETRADRTMGELGDRRAAASALLKLQYEELYRYEEEAADFPDCPDLESLIRSRVSGRIRELRSAFRERAAFYNACIRREIQPRSASHPIQRLRLEALGVKDYALVEERSSEAYRQEAEKAVALAEKRLLENSDPEDYRGYHDKLLRTVEAWEQAGRPLEETAYPDTVGALKELGRLSEAMALCDRAIRELPEDASTAYALYMRGCWLLHRWDAGGLELIYRAIDTNSNYLDEGLEQIGSFCCLSGSEEELERYRELAPQLLQREKDVFSQIGELKKGDRLSGETLPPELEEKLLRGLRELDQGRFDAVYLLHKQITPDFSTSPMVLRYRPEVSAEAREELYHRVFLLLDAVSDWQFSLFEYESVKTLKIEEIPGGLFYSGSGHA